MNLDQVIIVASALWVVCGLVSLWEEHPRFMVLGGAVWSLTCLVCLYIAAGMEAGCK